MYITLSLINSSKEPGKRKFLVLKLLNQLYLKFTFTRVAQQILRGLKLKYFELTFNKEVPYPGNVF